MIDVGSPHLRLEADGPIAWCTIDRPGARNALTPAMYHGITRAVRTVNQRDDLAALVITGVDDVFAPGGDLGGRREAGEADVSAIGMDILPFRDIRDSRAPVIAAVNGICQAGGMLIALLSDIAVTSERATFRAPELLRGIPDATFAAVLPAHVGVAVARDLLLSARTVGAAEAHRLGLVSRIVAHDDLHTAAEEAAWEILRTGPDARTHVKRMLNERYGTVDLPTMTWALSHSPEPREGMAAFMEKRPPAWVPTARDGTDDDGG